jgi:hypothetical protein
MTNPASAFVDERLFERSVIRDDANSFSIRFASFASGTGKCDGTCRASDALSWSFF